MEEFNMGNLYLAGAILVLVFGGALTWKIWILLKPRLKTKVVLKEFQKLGIKNDYFFGKYLFGLNEVKPQELVRCGETETEFIFFSSDKQIGSIPAKAVTNIFVEDKSKTSARFTATRFATLGVFALAFKKKKNVPSFYITLEWKTGQLQNQALFEFPSVDEANRATINLRNMIANI